ncbi:DUF4197 domain-containing protein [Allosphingosinicella sp.]|jgi:hypothetical protein|uniref:DUF4197 domain-containing protein n=1 Tax=Allosphingosinicella sp. TaxID=2823234 RepID=UPI002EE61502
MDQLLSRRTLLAAGCAFPLLALPACQSLPGFGMVDALRRILTLSSQRAFAGLLQDNGFFQSDVARIPLPPELSRAGGIASALLGSNLVQNQLMRLMNRAAANAAEVAAPMVYDAIRTMSFGDAMALVRGGPTAATDFLQQTMGNAIVDAMFPGVGNALRTFDDGIVNQVVRSATGINFAGLQRHVTQSAANGIYRAIGREEAAIRANPRSTNDPLIIGVFSVL